jgi:hypothetical protein
LQFPDTPPITWRTVGLFLFGNRSAVNRIADSPKAIWLGLWCVFLASFFREYDRADLWHDPVWLFLPLFASTSLATLLFAMLKLMPDVCVCDLPNRVQFRRLLTCFWMTAPLAVLYAIPVERFYSAVAAMNWNLNFLAVIAIWRVILITRVIQVLYGLSFFQALCPVMLLADTIAIGVTVLIPIPILQVMGGIQISEESELINQARTQVVVLGGGTWLIWLSGFAVSVFGRRSLGATPLPVSVSSITAGPWLLATSATIGMLVACCLTQPEQQRASHFRSLLLDGQTSSAIQFISQFSLKDLPPHWDAPPRIDYREQKPDLFQILHAITDNPDTPAWVEEIYAQKLLKRRGKMLGHEQFWYGLNAENVKFLVLYLQSHREVLKAFDQGGGDGEYSWGDGGSIRCTVAKLIENNLMLPKSQEPLPPDLVLQLLDLDTPNKQRSCGTAEEIREMLHSMINPDIPKEPSSQPAGFIR